MPLKLSTANIFLINTYEMKYNKQVLWVSQTARKNETI